MAQLYWDSHISHLKSILAFAFRVKTEENNAKFGFMTYIFQVCFSQGRKWFSYYILPLEIEINLHLLLLTYWHLVARISLYTSDAHIVNNICKCIYIHRYCSETDLYSSCIPQTESVWYIHFKHHVRDINESWTLDKTPHHLEKCFL